MNLTGFSQKIAFPKAFTAAILSFAWISSVNFTASAQTEVFTQPVGFYKVSLLTNSDTFASIPFTRIPEFNGLVSSVAGSVINVGGSPGWTAGQWATPTVNGYLPYFVLFISGAKEGAYYTVTNSGVSTLDVELTPEDLSGIVAGDKLRIIPFWTLNTIFPGGTGVVASANTLTRKTEVYMPDIGGVGKNLAPEATYFYFNSAWRKVGVSPATNFNDVVVLPDQYFFARQNNSADTTTLTTLGQVTLTKLRIPLYANSPGSGQQQDNYAIIARPAVQTLNDSGLSNAFVASPNTLSRKDELFVFDNAIQAKNKAPAGTYFYFNGGWRKVGVAPTVDFGPTNVFNPASGYYVRKATNTVATTIWVNTPNY